ncbi:MAG: hypothetical protein LBB05_00880 [Puniceicoccales bacterium]|nr:hypothetical protein [Puniceicoccales bacterium]
MDSNNSAIKVAAIDPIYSYVDKYWVDESLYSEWRNYESSGNIKYNTLSMVTGTNNTITAKVRELQAAYGNWTQNKNTQSELLKKCYVIVKGGVEADVTDTQLTSFNTETTGLGTGAADVYKWFFRDLFQMIYKYPVAERSTIPGRCNPIVTGTINDFEPLAVRPVTQNNETTTHVVIFTPIDTVTSFVEPSQDTVPKSHWESAKLILDNLEVTGEDSLVEYVNKQASELANRTNRSNKNGFYKIKRLLDEIEIKVDTYNGLTGSANKNITLSLVKWYNAIVDYAAQYIKISLQEHINDHLWDSTQIPYVEIDNAMDGTTPIADSNWKITSTQGTMLKYIQLSGTTTFSKGYLYPPNNPSELFKTINTLKTIFLENGGTIKTAFTKKTGVLDEIKMLQDHVTSLLQQYLDLTEEQKKGYNSQSIRAYIQALRGCIADNLCDYAIDGNGNEVITPKISPFPEMTKTLLVKCLKQLDNLRNTFEAAILTREVNTFYDWFINIEKLYYDWRINSASRKKLENQLNLFKGIKFEFELPKAMADDQVLTVDNVEIRSSPNMAEMMAKINIAITNINGIINTTGNVEGSKKNAASIAINEASTKLNAAKSAKEFRSIDDYFTCKDIIAGLQKAVDIIPNSGTLTDSQRKDLKTIMASSGEILTMASSSSYFSTFVINHIDEIIKYIELFNIEMPTDNDKKRYRRIADRYGFTGDCDNDQVAVIRLMDKIRRTIEDEFKSANDKRGKELLAAKISGRAVDFSVSDIMSENDRMRKYHQCWFDFERYASYLVTNFVHQNGTRKMSNGTEAGVDLKKCGYADADFGNIAKGTGSGGRLLTYYTVSGTGQNTTANRINKLNAACGNNSNEFTKIDYGTLNVDFSLDCLKLYQDYFLKGLPSINGTSTFQNIRNYMSFQGAYLDVQDYIKYFFEEHSDWRNNVEVNSQLRVALTNLRGATLAQQLDLSYQIQYNNQVLWPVGGTQTGSIGTRYCAEIDVTADNAETTLSDYIALLSSSVYGYNPYEDPEAIYRMRLAVIDRTLGEVLGNSNYDHSALFNTKSDTLLSGGQIITNDEMMENLIINLESLVKAWNREDEVGTKRIFDDLNKDGVYFLQNDGSYIYQGTKEAVPQTAYPRDGTVKIIAGDATTYETCKDGSVASTETKATSETVRNRIITNELLSVIDSLKNVYLNGAAIKSVGEVYYRLQMAEYVYAMAGKEAKNIYWHSPSGTEFLKTNGCYTFTMGSESNEAKFICGMVNGNVKIAQLTQSDLSTLHEKDMTWFEGKKDLQGVFYRYTDSETDSVLTSAELTISAGGKTYYSAGGGFFDNNGKTVSYDQEGFLIDESGTRIVKETSAIGGSSYMAYRIDGISGKLLGVAYNPTAKTEIEGSVLETYGMRFGNYRSMFDARAQYLLDEDVHALFVEEFNTIGTDFGVTYEKWKKDATKDLFSASSKSFSTKIAQFAAMFSSLSDTLGRHDVKRYNDKLAYADEELMLRRVNTVLKNLEKSDNDFENFANVATKAKEYFEILNKIAVAKSIGNIEGVEQYTPERLPKQQEYENAKLNAASDKGNFPAYVQSLSKSLKEKGSELKYKLSIITDYSTRSLLIANYAYLSKKCEMAENILSMVIGVDTVGEQVGELLANNGLQKDFRDVATLIQDGSSKYSERPVLSLAEIWGVERNVKMHVYGGWKGDSRDALLYKSVLNEFSQRTYFKNSEELPLISSDGVQKYITQMRTLLDPYIEELKKYEIYDGILRDVYVLDIIKDGRKRKIAGIGFNEIIKEHANWFITNARKATFLADLNALSTNLDLVINSYDTKGDLAGQMDAVLLQKIKNFKAYLGNKNDKNKKTYIGRVVNFVPYEDNKVSRDSYLYKIQSAELNEIIEKYQANGMKFEEYQEKINTLELRGGPLDEYITQLKDFLSYSQQLELYQKSLMSLVPILYANYRGKWHKAADLSETQLKETNGETYYRMIYGYGNNGEVRYIEDYDLNDEVVDPVYISSDSVWHGDYSHYGVMFRLMAILYEKFTTQKNLLADLLKEIQENNDKISGANKYLAKINKTQAQAARQGENARVVIPADVIIFFKQKNITMPTEFFGNDAEIATYENSNFNKRMTFLDNKGGISNLFSYVAQGRLKSGEEVSSNLMLADLSNRDLLELGTLKQLYGQTDYADAKFGDVSKKVKDSDPVAGFLTFLSYAAIMYVSLMLPGVALLAASLLAADAMGALGVGIKASIYGTQAQFHGTDQVTSGSDNTLLEAYWFNRVEAKKKDETAQVKSALGTYTDALISNMDGDYPPFPCSLDGIASNKPGSYGVGCSAAATNGFQLNDWAPASMGWGLTGHYQYLANIMGDASGGSSRDFESGANQHLVEAFDVLAHQKYYKQPKGVYKENYTSPDYDYNALILMYKLEALAETYGEPVAQIAVNYLSDRITLAQTIDSLNALSDPTLGDALLGKALTPEDVKMIKTYIDGPNLFTDDEDFPEYEKKTLTQCWTENSSIKSVLNKLYGNGSSGLNADEVSLWSDTMRTYIDKITTDGQTLSTKMQRMMQRCNETTSLATQMLKSIGDLWKQITGNIR